MSSIKPSSRSNSRISPINQSNSSPLLSESISLPIDISSDRRRNQAFSTNKSIDSSINEDSKTATKKKQTTGGISSYSLIGKDAAGSSAAGEEQYSALCKQLDVEHKNNKTLELQVC